MAASATLALKAGVWFRRGRLLIVSPDSLGTACPLSGRNSTYRPVQISAAGSSWIRTTNIVIENLADAVRRAQGAVELGEAVLWIRSTVADALDNYHAFQSAGTLVMLHHS